MPKQTFIIPNISCSHCIRAIKTEVSELEGVISVEGSVEGKSITVEWEDPVTADRIKDLLTDMNYPSS